MSSTTDTSTTTTHLEPVSRGKRWIADWRPEDLNFWDNGGAKVAKRNLIFSVLSEHVGFSVWSLWSVIVLFLGPQYHIDPAGKFLLTAVPTLVGCRTAAAVHVRRRQVRRAQLDHLQRLAAAAAHGPDRLRAETRCLVHARC